MKTTTTFGDVGGVHLHYITLLMKCCINLDQIQTVQIEDFIKTLTTHNEPHSWLFF